MKTGLLVAAASAALIWGGISARADVVFNPIQDPNGTFGTVASGINDAGAIVGSYVDSSGNSNGYTLAGGVYTTTDVAGAAATTPTGINNSGLITGNFTDSSGGVHGYTQSGVTATPFDAPAAATGGATFSSATNNAGTTAGYYFDSGFSVHGFATTGGSTTSLDVTGTLFSTQAYGINDSGVIVGSFIDGTTTQGFVDTAGTFTTIGIGADGTVVTSINNLGDLGGYYIDSAGITHGFVDLDGVIDTLDDPLAGPGGTEVLGINTELQVVGSVIDSNGNISGFSAQVPEPDTFVLFGLSVFGLVTLRRRTRGS